RVVFDFDDAIFTGANEPDVAWMCRNGAWVTPGNEYLAGFARQYTDRVTVIPTTIDTEQCLPAPRQYEGAGTRRVRVGWSGSDQSISTTLVPRLPLLARLQEKTQFDL